MIPIRFERELKLDPREDQAYRKAIVTSFSAMKLQSYEDVCAKMPLTRGWQGSIRMRQSHFPIYFVQLRE